MVNMLCPAVKCDDDLFTTLSSSIRTTGTLFVDTVGIIALAESGRRLAVGRLQSVQAVDFCAFFVTFTKPVVAIVQNCRIPYNSSLKRDRNSHVSWSPPSAPTHTTHRARNHGALFLIPTHLVSVCLRAGGCPWLRDLSHDQPPLSCPPAGS